MGWKALLFQPDIPSWRGRVSCLPQKFKSLKVIQANLPQFFHEELMQNQLSKGQSHGDVFPQVQQPWIQEAEIPTPESTTRFQ